MVWTTANETDIVSTCPISSSLVCVISSNSNHTQGRLTQGKLNEWACTHTHHACRIILKHKFYWFVFGLCKCQDTLVLIVASWWKDFGFVRLDSSQDLIAFACFSLNFLLFHPVHHNPVLALPWGEIYDK